MIHYIRIRKQKGLIVTERLKSLLHKVLNKETILYIVFGVLTTVISVVTYTLFYNSLPIQTPEVLNAASNCISWVISVAFAFVTNKLFVFESKSWKGSLLFRELSTFVSARLLSLLVDLAGMWLLVDCLGVNSVISKLGMNVLVIIINYVLSKWIIFKKDAK